MMENKIYISGKITGLKYCDPFIRFRSAEKEWLKAGYEVVNPMVLDHDHDKKWASYMRVCIKALMDCTHIYLMNNWQDSNGAIIEKNLADELGIICIFEK